MRSNKTVTGGTDPGGRTTSEDGGTGGENEPAVPTRRRHRGLKARIPAPLRHGATIIVIVLIIEYLVIPELERAHLSQLERIGVGWLLAGLGLEAASLLCYSLLARSLLPKPQPSLWLLTQVDMAATAVSHVVPGGTAASAALGYRLLTQEGVSRKDVGWAMASKGMGSAAVLNVMLWVSLVISIPLAGFHRIYIIVALVGLIVLLIAAGLVYAFTRGEEFAVSTVRGIGSRIPRVGADRLERLVRQLATSLREFSRDKQVMRHALLWATLNWALDAASLWCFVAALGHIVDPIELFAAYGIANVLAVLPITPSGLGLVEAVLPLLLASSGVSKSVATLAVIGWRLVNFWLPIPVGAAFYLSLRLPRGASLSARRQVLHELVTPDELKGEVLGLDSEPARPDAGGNAGPPFASFTSDPAEADADDTWAPGSPEAPLPATVAPPGTGEPATPGTRHDVTPERGDESATRTHGDAGDVARRPGRASAGGTRRTARDGGRARQSAGPDGASGTDSAPSASEGTRGRHR